MPPATGPALIILVAFVLPGFVTVLIQERTFKSAEDLTALDRLLRILYYSVWTYLLLAVAALAFQIHRGTVEDLYRDHEGNPAILALLGALLVLIPSLMIATSTRLWHRSRGQAWVLRRTKINERHTDPTAWDYFFEHCGGVYVRVTFRDGRRVLGFYGAGSFAAYAKDGRDLFLERIYSATEEGWFGAQIEGAGGVWLDTRDAISIEFYTPQPDASATTTSNGETASSQNAEGNRPPTS
jgi:Family of unknown function (DUF6338)